MGLTEKCTESSKAAARIIAAEEENLEAGQRFSDYLLEVKYLWDPQEIQEVDDLAKKRWEELWEGYNKENGEGGLTAKQIASKQADYECYKERVAELIVDAAQAKGTIDMLATRQKDPGDRVLDRLTV